MTPRTTRAHPVDIEVRGDGRTIAGIVAPFDTPAQIHDIDGRYIETIDRRAFDRTLAERGAERVKLLVQHQSRNLPIGRAHVLRPEARGLYGELRVSQTEHGDEVLELVRDGALDAFSIGFRPVRDQWARDRSTRRLLEVRLDEVSVVAFAAYDSARIEAVRSATTPHLLAAQRRLHELRKASPHEHSAR
jgi:HK97 family phage prohead protease